MVVDRDVVGPAVSGGLCAVKDAWQCLTFDRMVATSGHRCTCSKRCGNGAPTPVDTPTLPLPFCTFYRMVASRRRHSAIPCTPKMVTTPCPARHLRRDRCWLWGGPHARLPRSGTTLSASCSLLFIIDAATMGRVCVCVCICFGAVGGFIVLARQFPPPADARRRHPGDPRVKNWVASCVTD